LTERLEEPLQQVGNLDRMPSSTILAICKTQRTAWEMMEKMWRYYSEVDRPR